jgi:hypothetical protein
MERCPNNSPGFTSFTIWSLPLSLSFYNLQTPSLTQYIPFVISPSSNIASPFLMVYDVLHSAIFKSSSLDWIFPIYRQVI